MSTETQQAAAPAAPAKVAPEAVPAAAPEAADASVDAAAARAPEADAAKPTEDGVAAVEAGVAALSVAQPLSELHRFCAEGRLEDVRAILAHGVETLETLDLATGMTPIVLAIQNGHTEVVRELLAAGAIVPPPGVTGDPVMLSILYPQPMYGVPPPFAQMGPPQFYPPQNFYHAPMRSPNGGSAPNGSAPSPNGAANLPPAEVAKTIPCRNFPNCKYGASCMFFHPRPQQTPGFFPGPGYGYEGFVPYPGAVPFFPGAQEFVPGSAAQTPVEPTAENTEGAAGPVANGEPVSATSTTQHDLIPASAPAGAHVPSPIAPAFIPGGAPFMGSPTGGYAMGALSPTLLPTPPPHMPNDPAFFATSPQYQSFVPNGYPAGHGRRPSFAGQFSANGAPPKPYHGKKPSFSGGPKPWGPGGRPGGSSHLGTWKDGNPPPCAFFREGKCRNGEFCKFPHIDGEGNDVRHPDVIRGIIPPAPTRPPRGINRMMGGHYEGRHQPFVQGKQAATAAPVVESTAEAAEGAEAEAEAAPASAPAAEKETPASVPTPATLPPKPTSSSVPASRTTSQAGGSRVNGVNSRSHSPNGHPNGVRRGPRYANGHANGSRSSSANPDKKSAAPQRIPRADEFPALGLSTPSTPTAERREPSWGSKTAAQVLSEPAPVKAVPASSPTSPKAEETASEVVTMDSDSEQDAVIVSVSTTPNPEVAKAKLASAVSFASVAGTLGAEAAPVALKA